MLNNITPVSLSRTQIALAITSASILALQVTFTRIFSIIIWYHFTYLVVGIALLGTGAAGTYLAVRRWDRDTMRRNLGTISIGFSISIIINLPIMSFISFDPLSGGKSTIIGLIIYFAGLFITFFMGGLTIASIFSVWSNNAHRLYFADLIGASIGTLAVVWFVQFLGGPGSIGFLAIIVLVAAYLLRDNPSRKWKRRVVVVAIAEVLLFIFIVFITPLKLSVPQSKELGWALTRYQFDEPEFTRWNPVARVDVLPQTNFDKDISWIVAGNFSSAIGTEQNPLPIYPLHLVTLDGTSITALHQFDTIEKFQFLDYALVSAPYKVVKKAPQVLSIGLGGGLDILLARVNKASHITAVELNGVLIELLTTSYADFTGNLASDPNIELVNAEGRSFLTQSQKQYDLIEGIGVDNFAALSGGAYVLAESYIYTVESFEAVIEHLTDEGVFAWTRETNNPPREMLRIVGLAMEALRRKGVANPASHIVVVANQSGEWATLMISPTAFTTERLADLKEWVSANGFTFLQDPVQKLDTTYANYINASDTKAFEADYPFNIYPVYDDNPFFYNYFRWSDFRLSSENDNGDPNHRFPIGNLVLITMFTLSLLSAIAFIIIPLVRHQRTGIYTKNSLGTLAYFSILGMGYIFIEIVFIQRFTLFVGYPTLATSTTIFSMLFFSALGSLVARNLIISQARLRAICIILAIVILGYTFSLQDVLSQWQGFEDNVRIILCILVIAPVAFLMGMPFPTGIRQLTGTTNSLVPWAWGINGVFSVMGSVIVIILSMVTNFSTALLVAALLYLSTALFTQFVWKAQPS